MILVIIRGLTLRIILLFLECLLSFLAKISMFETMKQLILTHSLK